MNKVLVADLQMLVGAFCFGIGFIGQRAVSIDGLGPMTCNALRFSLSAIMLVVVLPWVPPKYLALAHTDSEAPDEEEEHEEMIIQPAAAELKQNRTETMNWLHRFFGGYLSNLYSKYYVDVKKSTLFWGVLLGVINTLGSGFQQWGITMTSANKVAFIAGFDLFLTPILALFIPTFKRNGKPTMNTWIAVFISMVGLYLLSDANLMEFEMGLGERLTLLSTFFWTLHITYTDIATNYINSIQMMIVQMIVVSVLSLFMALLLEVKAFFHVHHVFTVMPWILFVAIAEGLGFTLMALGQTYSPPTHAALILSLEGVFASVFSYMVLGETLTPYELTGCMLMLVATYIAKMGCCGIREKHTSSSPTRGDAAGEGGLTHGLLGSEKDAKINSSTNPVVVMQELYFKVRNQVQVLVAYLKELGLGGGGSGSSATGSPYKTSAPAHTHVYTDSSNSLDTLEIGSGGGGGGSGGNGVSASSSGAGAGGGGGGVTRESSRGEGGLGLGGGGGSSNPSSVKKPKRQLNPNALLI